MRKALAVAASTATMLALAAPAMAADTVTTFVIASGTGLAISAPVGTDAAPVNVANVAAGARTASGQLGPVKVTDTRANLVATWTATVSATDFVTGTTSANEASEVTAARTVAKASIAYLSGAGTAEDGQVGVMTPTVTGLTLASPVTASLWAGAGNNTVTWNPTLVFTLKPSQVAGTYQGTITHSVA